MSNGCLTCLFAFGVVKSIWPLEYCAAASLLVNILKRDPGVLFMKVSASFLFSNTLSSTRKIKNIHTFPPVNVFRRKNGRKREKCEFYHMAGGW